MLLVSEYEFMNLVNGISGRLVEKKTNGSFIRQCGNKFYIVDMTNFTLTIVDTETSITEFYKVK